MTKPIKQQILLQSIRDHSSGRAHLATAGISSTGISSNREAFRAPARFKPADRVPVFLSNCRQNIDEMKRALDLDDFQTVEFLGHRMRGAGGMFGFPEITDIGAALQEAAESGDAARSRNWVRELCACLDRVDTSRTEEAAAVVATSS